ncbi:MAG: hypothetical protein ACOY4D_03530 [Pseudomonadota bacterium]
MYKRIASVAMVAALGIAHSAQAAEFVYEGTFVQNGGNTAVEFPLQFSNVQQNQITAFSIQRRSLGTGGSVVWTDVTQLGCGVSSSYAPVQSFIASSSGVNGNYIATCGAGVSAGDVARVSVTVNPQQPLVLVAGPRSLAAGTLTKLSWLHGGGYFQCQPYTLNGQHPIWSSANFGLTGQITTSTQGDISLAASSTPRTVSFALQCIASTGFNIPPVAVVNVTVR